jgi:hypothetical protein
MGMSGETTGPSRNMPVTAADSEYIYTPLAFMALDGHSPHGLEFTFLQR